MNSALVKLLEGHAEPRRAASLLLTLGDTKEADTPSLDDPDLDF